MERLALSVVTGFVRLCPGTEDLDYPSPRAIGVEMNICTFVPELKMRPASASGKGLGILFVSPFLIASSTCSWNCGSVARNEGASQKCQIHTPCCEAMTTAVQP